MKVSQFIILIGLGLISFSAQAGEETKPNQFRIYAGQSSFNPDQLNSALSAAGIAGLKSATLFGGEYTYLPFTKLNVGARVQVKYAKVLENANPSANPLNPYYASLQQYEGFFITRVDVVKTNSFKFDVVGGAGLSSIKADVRTSTGEGTFSRASDTSPYFASLAGASVGFGFGNLYLFVEGGQEWNSASNLTRSGLTSSSVTAIDVSGPYVFAGIILNGVPSFVKLNSKN
jgi:hypothetical protein